MNNKSSLQSNQNSSRNLKNSMERVDSFSKTLQDNRIRFFHDSSPAAPDSLRFNQTAPAFGIKRNLLKFFDAVKSGQSNLATRNRESSKSSQNMKKDGKILNIGSKLPPRLKINNSTPALQSFDEPNERPKNQHPKPQKTDVSFNALMESNAQATKAYLEMKKKLTQCQKISHKADLSFNERENRVNAMQSFDERRKTNANISFNNLNVSYNQNSSFNNGALNGSFNRGKHNSSFGGENFDSSFRRDQHVVYKKDLAPNKNTNSSFQNINSSFHGNSLNTSMNKENMSFTGNQGQNDSSFNLKLKQKETSKGNKNNLSKEIAQISRNMSREQYHKMREMTQNLSRDNSLNVSRERSHNISSNINLNQSNRGQKRPTPKNAQNSGTSVNLPTPLALIRSDSNERGSRDPSPAQLSRPNNAQRKHGVSGKQPPSYYQVNMNRPPTTNLTRMASHDHSFQAGGRQSSSLANEQSQVFRHLQHFHSKANVLREITVKESSKNISKNPPNSLFNLMGGVPTSINSNSGNFRDRSFNQ